MGFVCRKVDSSLVDFQYELGTLLMQIYAIDFILIGSNSDMGFQFIRRLKSEFSLQDLEELQYFLGIQVVKTSHRLFLNQAKYALDILEHASMKDCKSVSTPLSTKNNLHLTSGPSVVSPADSYQSRCTPVSYYDKA